MNSELHKVIAPISSASGLPNEHYVSTEMFQKEKELLFYENWSGVGFSKDIPNVGDALPINFLGFPLLAVRDQNNDVVVFQNTCRHRGMILVEEKKNIRGTIRCPYHSWSYNLDGQLRATPHVAGPGENFHENIKKDELGLVKIQSYIFLGVIFVNISGKAGSFQDANSTILSRWNDFDKDLHFSETDSSFSLDVNCNWKLAVENYCESYHLPWVHPELNIVSKLEDHYNIWESHKFSGQGSKLYNQIRVGKKVFDDFNNLSEKWDKGSEYIALFPNVLLGVHRDHIFSMVLNPLKNDLTEEIVRIFYPTEGCLRNKFAPLRKKNTSFWKSVFKEDIFVVEGMQCGRHGSYFDGGRFSPIMDGPTHNFHSWVANKFINDQV